MANFYESTLKTSGIRAGLDPEKLSVGWPWRLFSFSFLIILTAGVVYFGLAFGYKNFLSARVAEVDEEILQLSEAIPQDQQDKLINFYNQLANLELLLNNHIVSSNIFPLLEKNTNQGVFFNSAEFKVADRRLSLDGVANSYQALSQQLEAFNRVSEIERAIINESYLSGGKVFFRLYLVLSSKVFIK